MSTPLIEFQKVSKRFGTKVILDKVDLRIYPQEVTTLIGKSGVGKSVTLKLIIGLLEPDEGKILYQGQSLQSLRREERQRIKDQVNFMFQNNALFDSMHVFDNIALPLKEKTRLGTKAIQERVAAKMQALDLTGIEYKYPSQISGGMQKRVALARALVTDPQVVLFDEPTTGLDPIRKNSVLSMITHNQRDFGFTAVLVSHDVPDVFYISNRIAVLEEAHILFEGSPLEMEQSDLPVISEYLNSVQSLENEIIDLKSRRDLEAFFFALQKQAEKVTIILLTIENLERVKERIGQLMAHQVVSTVAGLINTALGQREHECGRYSQDRILCVLPGDFSQEVDAVIAAMEHPLEQASFFHPASMGGKCTPFEVQGGWAMGAATTPLQNLVEQAEGRKQRLANLLCGQDREGRGAGNE